MSNFDLQAYMTKGVERIVTGAIKATLKNPKESVFMVKFAAASRTASQKRAEWKKRGEHIPPFLIASITSKCNLHINSHGGAEPCPFSPYSDVNVKDQPLLEALKSPLFTMLRSGDILLDEHKGGCVLYAKKDEVEAIILGNKAI